MKICGIIAEYNPFHDGHAYQIREAKRLSGADAVVVIMSGYFVQRGEPAVFDPFVRAGAALKSGADVVFMMPPEASTASAEIFASYGVKVLDALGCDCISCGIEAGINKEEIMDIASGLADELAETGFIIRNALQSGKSYPAAISCAAGLSDPALHYGPNTILAIEYLKAMIRIGSSMTFVPVQRKGSAYNDTELYPESYPSATALRRVILEKCRICPDDDRKYLTSDFSGTQNSGSQNTESQSTGSQSTGSQSTESQSTGSQSTGSLNAESHNIGSHNIGSNNIRTQILRRLKIDTETAGYGLGPDDFVGMIALSATEHENELEDFADCSRGIASRIKKSRFCYGSFEEMVTDIKTKDVTYTRISRTLMHILLGIRRQDMQSLNSVSYAQLIGFSNGGVLKEINKRALRISAEKGNDFMIISKAADHKDKLESTIYSARIYNQALWSKYRKEGIDLLRQKILKI